ncbi:MAG: thiamine-phosphate kinase, partial [Rhizomicrobium sp.]
MNEFEAISRYFAPLATGPGAFALKDDAAIVRPRPGFDLVLTADQVAEGTDFFPGTSPGLVAKKALRVNLSDLAAKGAMPAYYLLALSLPSGVDEEWLEAFASGLKEDQDIFQLSLLGGDMQSAAGPVAVGITAIGFVPEGGMVTRAGARPGDDIYVTGTIGDSGAGLSLVKSGREGESGEARALVARYHLPEPPVGFAPGLRKLATAAIDVSDGLMADLG